jgi:apolipoprotein N-acyltransferase
MSLRQESKALRHRLRFLGALCAWGLFFAASPGVLVPGGLPALAVLGVATWAWVEARPPAGRPAAAFLAHALGALPGAAALMLWIRYVYAPPLLYIGLGMGVYSAAGGVLLRRLLRALPAPAAPLAVALAWTAMETLRANVPMPFGLGWMRLGYQAHAWPWLAGSARVWGVSGLTCALAGLGGLATHLARARAAGLRPAALACGLGPALLGLALALCTAPPPTVPGPRILIVQPGFPQERKMHDEARLNFAALRDQTRDALAAERAAGHLEPDLVAWGESMLYVPVFEEGVRALALDHPPEDGEVTPTKEELALYERVEDAWVDGELFGRGPSARGKPGVLPQGTSFIAGAEASIARDGRVQRLNAVALYGASGGRHLAAKRFLVPGAETMYGLERIPAVRDFIRRVADYVPSFAAAEETGVLPLTARDGRSYRIAATVCFDNAHLSPYTDPVRDGRVDLHLVVSNEAWYRESFEVDQMVAFTRIAALASGRAVVRATNSGISLVMGPDGRELGRIAVGGKDRMVKGTLAAEVPVPEPGAGAPPIARLRPYLDALWVLFPLALAAAAALRRRRVGNPDRPAG